MEATYVVAVVKIGCFIRFYTGSGSERASYETELAKCGLDVFIWAEGNTQEEAMKKAYQSASLKLFLCGEPFTLSKRIPDNQPIISFMSNVDDYNS